VATDNSLSTFKGNAGFLRRWKGPLRLLLSAVFILACLLPVHRYGLIAGIFVVYLGLAALQLARFRWGNEVAFEGGALILRRNSVVARSIPRESITLAMQRKDTLSFALDGDGRKQFVIISGESFSEVRFAELVQAFKAFVPETAWRADATGFRSSTE